jgi:hypothetical protein
MISLNEANMSVLLNATTEYFGVTDENMFKIIKKMKNGEVYSFREVPLQYLIKRIIELDVAIPTIKRLSDIGYRDKLQIDGTVSVVDLVLDFVIFKKINNVVIPIVIELQGDYHYGSINGSNLQTQIARDIAKEFVLKSENIEFYAFKLTKDCEFSPIAMFVNSLVNNQKET